MHFCMYQHTDLHFLKSFLDGGWGVDALLGYQSRAHNDIDSFDFCFKF